MSSSYYYMLLTVSSASLTYTH